MKVNKYLVLHSGDRVLLTYNIDITDTITAEEYYNKNLKTQIQLCTKDIQDTASHIELVPLYWEL